MSKILSLDLGSSSCRLLLTEKSITNFEILFYAEKTYAEPVRDTFNEENRIIVTNQLKNLVRDFKNIEKEIDYCNIGFGGSSHNSVIIQSSMETDKGDEIITQEQISLLTKNNPKINSFITHNTTHIIPLEYSLDGMNGIRHPLGMHSKKIEIHNLYVNLLRNQIDLVQSMIIESGLQPKYLISEIIASSSFLLNADEKEIGSLIIDIGAASTDFCLNKKGNPVYTGSIPVGGNQFTSDLSIAFSTNLNFANQLKLETSCTPENERIAEKIIIKDKDSTKTTEITKRQISQVLKERVIEIFTMIKHEIIENLGQQNLPERIILTGGGSKTDGIVAQSRYIFQAKSRLADTKNMKFLGENLTLESLTSLSMANYMHNIDFNTEFTSQINNESTGMKGNIEISNITKFVSNIQTSVKMNILEFFKKIKSIGKR
ncbi:MAG: cell division protein FtsA [Chloroflexi bacterium]|nr:cell division protein FtsA [Chloroflexota bacterium]|tara:strand:- start:11023 stop:12315 length:1293 start_codon:yes stop_codon:yes gene_type:complete